MIIQVHSKILIIQYISLKHMIHKLNYMMLKYNMLWDFWFKKWLLSISNTNINYLLVNNKMFFPNMRNHRIFTNMGNYQILPKKIWKRYVKTSHPYTLSIYVPFFIYHDKSKNGRKISINGTRKIPYFLSHFILSQEPQTINGRSTPHNIRGSNGYPKTRHFLPDM
jgi:hypothetical protein